jgi:hypothetical protein
LRDVSFYLFIHMRVYARREWQDGGLGAGSFLSERMDPLATRPVASGVSWHIECILTLRAAFCVLDHRMPIISHRRFMYMREIQPVYI